MLEKTRRCIVIDMKASTSPRGSRGFHEVLGDIGVNDRFTVVPLPAPDHYPIDREILVETATAAPNACVSLHLQIDR